MPFGVRQLSTLPASAHDFDDVYQRLVIPAARAADWEVVRIDEVAATGSISDQYLHELYTADLVAADSSMPNGNVYYELGVRQAISPSGDLLIAIQDTPVPFDLQSQRVFFYPREDAEWAQFQRQLQTVLQRHGQDLPRNPVREYLERQGHVVSLSRDSAGFESELNGRIDRARNAEQLVACWHWARKQGKLPVSATLALAERLGDAGYICTAVDVLANAGTDSNDYEVHRQLGFYRRKLGPEHEEDALESFKRAAELNSSDPETWGMMGGLYKRQRNYPAARDAYDRGATLSPSNLYMRVNQAVMSVLTAAGDDPGYGIALYQRLYDSVVDDPNSTADYWALLVAAEAAFVLGWDERAHELFDDAANLGARAGDLRSSAEQLQLLADAGYRPSEANQLAVMLLEKANTLEGRLRPVPLAFDRREETRSTGSKIIFHLSDLHFGGQTLPNGQYRNMHRFYDSE